MNETNLWPEKLNGRKPCCPCCRRELTRASRQVHTHAFKSVQVRTGWSCTYCHVMVVLHHRGPEWKGGPDDATPDAG